VLGLLWPQKTLCGHGAARLGQMKPPAKEGLAVADIQTLSRITFFGILHVEQIMPEEEGWAGRYHNTPS